MPNIITIVHIIPVTMGLTLAPCAAAFAQAANGPPTSLATKPAPPEAAQKRQADAQHKDLQERNAKARDSDRPAIGPSTTEGLAQESIARSNRR